MTERIANKEKRSETGRTTDLSTWQISKIHRKEVVRILAVGKKVAIVYIAINEIDQFLALLLSWMTNIMDAFLTVSLVVDIIIIINPWPIWVQSIKFSHYFNCLN